MRGRRSVSAANWRDDDRRALRRLQLLPVFRVGEEGNLPAPAEASVATCESTEPSPKHIAAKSGDDFVKRSMTSRTCRSLLAFGQRLDDLIGDVEFRADPDDVLQDQIVLFGFGDLLDRLVGLFDDRSVLFVLAQIQIFAEFALSR